MEKGKMFFLVIAAGLVLFAADYFLRDVSELPRNMVGKSSYEESLVFTPEGTEDSEEMVIDVLPQSMSEAQCQELIVQAKKEIDETFLGDNESTEAVKTSLCLKESYANGKVKAAWEFDDYSVCGSDGSIDQARVSKGGNVVNALVTLEVENYEEVYSFPFMVVRDSVDDEAGLLRRLQEKLATVNEETRNTEFLVLPKSVGGKKISWKRKLNFRGLELAGLGLVLYLIFPFLLRKEEQSNEEKRNRQLVAEYPIIVNELSILMSSGMSLARASRRIGLGYKRGLTIEGKESPGYELIYEMSQEIEEGIPLLVALENMGRKSDQKEYRKLSMLLQQSIKKGGSELMEQLDKEDQMSFEMRKQNALRLGEEASTKLLVPMIGMLGIVMVIIIVPAILNMNF